MSFGTLANGLQAIAPGVLGAGGSVASFTPAQLFTTGVQGYWYDPSDLTKMWQDSARTAAAAVNSPVGAINDKSGNGNHATQATAASRPILRSAGGFYWLEFDGVDDFLATPAFALNGASADGFGFYSGQYSNTSTAIVAESGANYGSNGGVIMYVVDSAGRCAIGSNRGAAASGVSYTQTASTNHTVTAQWVGAVPVDVLTSNIPRLDSAAAPSQSAVGAMNGSNFGNSNPMYIGARAGSSLFLAGRLYSLGVVGKLVSGAELTSTETYVTGKTG